MASITPDRMPKIATVNERFQSYNVEMIEVTGGRFWKAYKDYRASKDLHKTPSATSRAGPTPAGMDPNMYQYRPPIDLANPKLRKLAAALGPAYVRVSGTWANTVYFQDSDAPPPKSPPEGFGGVLTRKEWKGVIDFVRAVDGELMTSFATGAGNRNPEGVWVPKEADRWLAFTKSAGGQIAATEFMNEPTYAAMGGAPKGYDAAMYARDVAVFRPWLKRNSPGTIFLGPGSVGEGSFSIEMSGMLHTEDLMKATGPVFDVFSYHLYAAASERCASVGPETQTSATDALSREWFSRADEITSFYAKLRDRYLPGKPLWLTETADAACGGNPWASTFLDSFRYLDQHGRLAKRGVQVIAHNTLASSDYGLLDENTFDPRPNYWASFLWRTLMGNTVLDPGTSPTPNLYLYAHCLREHAGGVALLAINADRQTSAEIQLPVDSERYMLTAKQLEDTAVQLNGTTLALGADGSIPVIRGVETKAGQFKVRPESITFFAIPTAGNANCP